MSDSPSIQPTADNASRQGLFILGGFGLLLVLILSAVTETSSSLVFGWLFFLNRSLASFQPDGPTFWVGIGAFALLFAIVHRIGRRSAAGPRWTWRSTTAICLGITLLFAASVAMVASLHQMIWLASHSSPLQSVAKWSRSPGPLSFVAQARQAAQRTQSKNQIKQFLLGMHNYHDVYSQFPPGAIVLPDGRGYRGWMPPLGPYIGFNDPWSWKHALPWDDPQVAEFGKGALPMLMHPDLGWHGQFDDRGFAFMHYAGNVHLFPNNRGLKLDEITDGTSNTLAIGEVAENFQPWASPWNRRDPADGINDVPWGFGGPTWQNGAQFGMADGSVRFLSRNIDREVLKALGTPAGGESLPDEPHTK